MVKLAKESIKKSPEYVANIRVKVSKVDIARVPEVILSGYRAAAIFPDLDMNISPIDCFNFEDPSKQQESQEHRSSIYGRSQDPNLIRVSGFGIDTLDALRRKMYQTFWSFRTILLSAFSDETDFTFGAGLTINTSYPSLDSFLDEISALRNSTKTKGSDVSQLLLQDPIEEKLNQLSDYIRTEIDPIFRELFSLIKGKLQSDHGKDSRAKFLDALELRYGLEITHRRYNVNKGFGIFKAGVFYGSEYQIIAKLTKGPSFDYIPLRIRQMFDREITTFDQHGNPVVEDDGSVYFATGTKGNYYYNRSSRSHFSVPSQNGETLVPGSDTTKEFDRFIKSWRVQHFLKGLSALKDSEIQFRKLVRQVTYHPAFACFEIQPYYRPHQNDLTSLSVGALPIGTNDLTSDWGSRSVDPYIPMAKVELIK